MSSISKSHDDNYGGIMRLWVAATQDVIELMDLPLLANNNSVSLAQAFVDANFHEIGFVSRTAGHDWTPAGEGEWNHQMRCRVRKDREDVRAHALNYVNRTVTLIYLNGNGERKMLHHMRLQSSGQTGNEPSEGNVTNLVWNGRLPYLGIGVVVV